MQVTVKGPEAALYSLRPGVKPGGESYSTEMWTVVVGLLVRQNPWLVFSAVCKKSLLQELHFVAGIPIVCRGFMIHLLGPSGQVHISVCEKILIIVLNRVHIHFHSWSV